MANYYAPQLSYVQRYNMAQQIGAATGGIATAEHLDFGTYVGGGTAMCVGLPLAFKTAKGVVYDIPKWGYQNFGNYKNAFGTLVQSGRDKLLLASPWNTSSAFAKGKDATEAMNIYNQAKHLDMKGKNWIETVNNIDRYKALDMKAAKLPVYEAPTSCMLPKNYSALVAADKANGTSKAAEALKAFNEKQALKSAMASKKADCYKEAAAKIKEIKASGLKGKELKSALKEVDNLILEGDRQVAELVKAGEIKATSRLGKIGAGLKKVTGYNALNRTLIKGAQSSNKFVSIASKGTREFIRGGGALTAAIELGLEVPEIYKTYKELGAKSGTKQLGKSAAVAVASGVGYAVGAKVGAVAGAKVGAAIGTCIGGPIGTAIGGVLGSVIGIGCGLLGSWAASKGMRALVGKSEREKANESNAREMALAAGKSVENEQTLMAAYEQVVNGRQDLLDEGVQEAATQETTAQEAVAQDNTAAQMPELIQLNNLRQLNLVS